jgi:putative peptide zinc metalloprotease protein
MATAAVVAGAIAFVAFVPFPYHIDCVAEIQPSDAFAVRTMVPGRLVSFNKRPGDIVNAGDVIAQLENVDLLAQRENYLGEYELSELKYRMQSQKANRDPDQASALVSVESQAQSAKEQLDIADRKLTNLTIVSQQAGVVIAPPAKDGDKMAMATDQLPTWSGSPFDAKNENAFFAEGDLICYIGDPKAMEAIVIIDQGDIQDLRNELGDQARVRPIDPAKSPQVEIMLESARLSSLYGRLTEIADSEMKESPQSLASASGGTLDTKTDPSTGKVMPLSASYQAKVKLDESNLSFRSGYRGEAKIHLKWKTLGWRLYRILSKTFNFEF